MTKTLLALTLAVLCAGAALAQSRTPRVGLDYTGSESENRTLTKLDATAPLGRTARNLLLCGQGANAGTIYVGPMLTAFNNLATVIIDTGDAACAAGDNATEGTADFPIQSDFPAFRIVGGRCSVDTDPTGDVVFTIRSAEADLSPSLTCTVAGSGSLQHCDIRPVIAPTVAAGATIAAKVVGSSDNLSAVGVGCLLQIQYN